MIHRSLVTDSATAPPMTTWCPTARAASRAEPTVPGYAARPWRVGVGEVGVPAPRIHHLLNRWLSELARRGVDVDLGATAAESGPRRQAADPWAS